MPKYEDLQYLKEKIVNLGREPEILSSKGKTISDDNLPDMQSEPGDLGDSFNDLLSDSLLDDIETDTHKQDQLSNDDFLASLTDSKNAEQPVSPDINDDNSLSEFDDLNTLLSTFSEDASLDNTADTSEDLAVEDEIQSLNESGSQDFEAMLDNLDFGETPEADITDQTGNDSVLPDTDSFDFQLSDEATPGTESAPDIIKPDDLDDFGALAGDLLNNNSSIEDSFATGDNNGLVDILSSIEPEKSDDYIKINDSQISDLDSLMALGKNNSPLDNIDEEAGVNEIDDLSINEGLSGDGLDDLLNIPSLEENNQIDENIDISSMEDNENLSDNLATNEKTDEITDASSDIEGLSDITDIAPEESLTVDNSSETTNLTDMLNNFSLSDTDNESNDDSLADLSGLDDILSLDENKSDAEDELPVVTDDGDEIAKSVDENEEFAETTEPEELSDVEEQISEPIIPTDKEPEKTDENALELSIEERKNIILALSTFPKDAELKLAKTIVTDKIDDEKKMPLVRALINHEPQSSIVKLYEKLTHDMSLNRLATRKFTGEHFERKQKSFIYNLEKNILPMLSRIASILVIVFVMAAFYIMILEPTIVASTHYKLGKKNIERLDFDNVEPNFEIAYKKQPRYKEIISYARKYREYERYLDAERKYRMAGELKDDRILDLEFADFYREIKKYEKSVSAYNFLLDKNRKDIEARIGLGKTNLDWSNEQKSKLIDAEDNFQEVLDIAPKNFEAINQLILTYIKKDQEKKVINSYKYLEQYYPKKSDPEIYTQLASYMLDKGHSNEVKEILKKASLSLKKGDILPELDYQYARYHKSLNVTDKERFYLENAVRKLDLIKRTDIRKRYSDTRFIRLKSMIYNDLGENYYYQSKTNIKAEEMFNKAVGTDPDYAKPYFNLGNFAYVTKGNREEALFNYIESEKRGYTSDILDYNVGWLSYRAGDYYESYRRINKLLNKKPDSDNLKFMTGTILYKLGKYELSESILLETYDRFDTLKQANSPLDMGIKDHKYIVEMLFRTANNLGASLQKKYQQTRKAKYEINAHNYYAKSIELFDMFSYKDNLSGGATSSSDPESEYLSRKYQKSVPHLNLRSSLYPDSLTKGDAIVYEDFNQFEYMK